MNNDKRKWNPGSWIPKTDVDQTRSTDSTLILRDNISICVDGLWFDVYPSTWIDGSDGIGRVEAYLVRWELSDYEIDKRGLV